MARTARTNIMRVFVGDTPLAGGVIAGERLLCLPTSVKGWQIAIGEKDAAAVRDALGAFVGEADSAQRAAGLQGEERRESRDGDHPAQSAILGAVEAEAAHPANPAACAAHPARGERELALEEARDLLLKAQRLRVSNRDNGSWGQVGAALVKLNRALADRPVAEPAKGEREARASIADQLREAGAHFYGMRESEILTGQQEARINMWERLGDNCYEAAHLIGGPDPLDASPAASICSAHQTHDPSCSLCAVTFDEQPISGEPERCRCGLSRHDCAFADCDPPAAPDPHVYPDEPSAGEVA